MFKMRDHWSSIYLILNQNPMVSNSKLIMVHAFHHPLVCMDFYLKINYFIFIDIILFLINFEDDPNVLCVYVWSYIIIIHFFFLYFLFVFLPNPVNFAAIFIGIAAAYALASGINPTTSPIVLNGCFTLFHTYPLT